LFHGSQCSPSLYTSFFFLLSFFLSFFATLPTAPPRQALTDKLMRQVQNAAARLITGAKRRSRTHHTDIASTSLVAGQTTSGIQDGQLGIPSAVKQSTWLPGRRYSSRLRKFCSLPQVLFGEKVLCHLCSQSFW